MKIRLFSRTGLKLAALLTISGAAALAATGQVGPASKTTARALRLRVSKSRPLRLYYYVDDARGFASLQEHAREIGMLAPQSFWIDVRGFVHGALPPRIKSIVRETHIPVMLLVFNPDFNRATVHAVLRSAVARRRALIGIARIARLDSVVGVQIDLENIDPADRKLYSSFVRRAAAALHHEGRLLSVALVPRFSGPAPGTGGPAHPSKHTQAAWAAAFDYRALGRAADFVTVMAYDHSGRDDPPGPIAGLSWVDRAIAYTMARIPNHKILLGIPLYGREWIYDRGKYNTQSLAFADVGQILARHHIEPLWDAQWQEPWFSYHVDGGLRTVYYEDQRSLRGELDLVSRYRLRGYAAWRLGDEDPAFWTTNKPIASR
ncbi:MAG TPA: glycosyl hydrolase family 18 protein [Terriglobia bacterium]|nr:glycosyl hydrolase family 18 protein [Terriglobia bacterium]